MRYFIVRYTDLEKFDADVAEPLNEADGLILYALPTSEEEVTKLVEKARDRNTANRKETLVAIPRTIGFLQDAVTQLAYLHWIAENTPELEGDIVARRELSARTIEADREVSNQLAEVFGDNSEDSCTWYHKGKSAGINSPRSRNAYLSEIVTMFTIRLPLSEMN